MPDPHIKAAYHTGWREGLRAAATLIEKSSISPVTQPRDYGYPRRPDE